MIDKFYEDEPMDDLNKVLFAFAAYNCGPGRIRQLRRQAAARGLDQNIWFDNVERVPPRDRPGNSHLREQHLQVLRVLSPRAGRVHPAPKPQEEVAAALHRICEKLGP
jgi:hypothetical protein